jgi:hypothetical protein
MPFIIFEIMKWSIIVLFSIMCILVYGQELSMHLPITADKRSDTGQQILAIDDGFLIAGTCFCHDMSSEECLGLLRVNKDGNIIWTQVIDGAPESGLDMEGLTLVLIGNTAYIATEVWKSGQKEIRIMSFDIDGNLVNQKDLMIPHTSQLYPRGMIQDGNKLILYGEVANNGHRIFIVVLDTQLNVLEEHFIGNPYFDKRFMEMNKLDIGGYVLAYGEDSPLDVFVVIIKLDEDFNVIFSTKMLQAVDEFASVNIHETDDKGFLLAWHKDMRLSLADTFPYPTTIYKLDSLANVEWQYVFAHKSAKQHISMVEVSDGKMLGIGGTDYWGINNIYPERWADGWCFLMSAEGQLLWERSIADIRDSNGGRFWHGIETDNGFAFVGDIDKINLIGTPFINDPEVWFLTLDENGCWNGNCDKYIVVTGDSTSITGAKEAEVLSSKIVSYPNPTNSILIIECEKCKLTQAEVAVWVFNIKGDKLLETNLYGSKTTLDLSHLASGVYFATQVIGGNPVETEKIIVHH